MKLFRRILVPHDFSDHASRALALATQLARQSNGRLLVLHVLTPFKPITGVPEEAMVWVPATTVAGERSRLAALVARTVGRRGPRVDCKVVVGDAFERILEAAGGCDVVVMSTAGRTGLARLVIGSIAEKIVRHSPVPVLTLRPARVRPLRRTRRRTRRGRRAARRAYRTPAHWRSEPMS
jgi:nucleotide-binding universal stress UspA family protein